MNDNEKGPDFVRTGFVVEGVRFARSRSGAGARQCVVLCKPGTGDRIHLTGGEMLDPGASYRLALVREAP